MVPNLPKHFTSVITSAYGDAGARWLGGLPRQLEEISKDWELSLGPHYPNLSYHYVAPCVCADGGDAVLKLGFPEDPNPTIFHEAAMLNLNAGEAMVTLLRFDPDRRAMLLEKLTPGEHLRALFAGRETDVIGIAVDLMKKIWRDPPAGNNFPALEDWFNNGFEKARKTSFPSEYIQKAGRMFEELNSSTGRRVLLHGDLHHWNILSAQREPYLVIDPKGITGNFGYELSTFLINHSNWLAEDPDRKEKLGAAIGLFSEAFGLETVTIRKWTFAQSVLSAWWTFEEGSENWRRELARAEIWDV